MVANVRASLFFIIVYLTSLGSLFSSSSSFFFFLQAFKSLQMQELVYLQGCVGGRKLVYYMN